MNDTTPTGKTSFATVGHRDLTHHTTRWERVLHRGRSGSGVLQQAQVAVAVAQREHDLAAGKAAGTPCTDADDFGAEVFARLYGDPAKLDEPVGPRWVGPAHDVVTGLPEFEALRQSTAGDPDMAALAAATILSEIAPKLAALDEEGKRDEADPEGQSNAGNRATPDAAAARAAMRRAVAKAGQEVAEAREDLAGLAPGLEAAPPQHGQADPARMKLAEALRKDKALREIMRRAGRIQRLARERNTTRDLTAREEVVDVERGNDLARALPAGLSQLHHKLLRRVALRNLLERQMLQYRLEGRETLGRGPVVVLLDRSGSMQGDPERWASAIAISMLGIASKEGRRATIIEFTTRVDTVTVVDGKTSPLAIAAEALKLAGRRSYGGTDFGPALQAAMDAGALDDRADVVIVTDGCAEADEATLARLVEAKGRGLRLYALTLNGGSASPAIQAIADVAVDLDRVADVGKAIAEAIPKA
jgi:uncharacterized protein with von Willebrand factor type A (vWA) domain